jgi:hypothetical protein
VDAGEGVGVFERLDGAGDALVVREDVVAVEHVEQLHVGVLEGAVGELLDGDHLVLDHGDVVTNSPRAVGDVLDAEVLEPEVEVLAQTRPMSRWSSKREKVA